jgi:hypothetical protein
MAQATVDRVKVTTATTGTGTPTLGSAVAKFLTGSEAGMVNGLTYTYLIEEGNDFEIGVGVYNSSTPSITRATVLKSKISGVAGTTKMSLAGSATIAIILSAADLALIEMNRALNLTMLQVADNSNLPIFTDQRIADHFDVLTYVDVAGATNLVSSVAGVLRPSASSSAISQATGTATHDGSATRGTNWYDGVTGQDDNNTSFTTGSSFYQRRQYSPAKAIAKAVIHGSNNAGYATGTPLITITLYGKNGTAPASGTDGTVLGSISFTDLANESVGRDIVSTDLTTTWDYVWTNITGATGLQVAEVVFHEATGVNNLAVNSTSITAPATVSAMSGLILIEENVAAVAGTDYTLKFSANGGTNYTTATLTEVFSLVTADGTLRVVEAAETAIANTGTALRWKFETLNNKNVEFHGIVMRWS